jgi:hypothetical protein
LLLRGGIDAIVFEGAPHTGGRAHYAQFLLGRDVFQKTFDLIETLGLSHKVIPIRQTVGQLYHGRVYHHHVASASGLLHFKGLNLLDKVLLPKMSFFCRAIVRSWISNVH